MAYRPYIWRKNNPEKRLEQKRREKVRRTLRDKGILPSVGVEMNQQQKVIDQQISNNDFSYWDSIKQGHLNGGGRDKQTHVSIKPPEYLIWYRAKNNAKEYGYEFNLEIDDIVIPTHCPYLGIELNFNPNNTHNQDYYSIDRIDSSKGYVKGNIQVISRFANTMKNNSTIEQLITFSQNVLKIHTP